MIITTHRLRLAVAVTAACLLATACGGSSGGADNPTVGSSSTSAAAVATPTAPADAAGATKEIKQVWSVFFDAATPVAKGKTLLEDGDQLGAALRVASQERKDSGIRQNAKVKIVSFLGPDKANVTYALLNGKTPVLPAASGQAVLIDGQWKVSKLTFCTLVKLGANGKDVPGCQ